MTALLILAALVLLLLAARSSAMPYIGSFSSPADKIETMATGIAQAEGWFLEGSLPQRANNPGALRLHGEFDTITTFASPGEGWQALYQQVDKMLSGQSDYYSLDMSIWQVAERYTGGDNPAGWAIVVAGAMGVTPSDTLRAYMEG